MSTVLQRWSIVCLVSFLPCAIVAAGENSAPLAWTDCVLQAASNRPELAIARERILQARENTAVEQSARRPSVSLRAGTDVSGRDSGDPAEQYSAGLQAEQRIYDGGQTGHGVAAAREQEQGAAASYAATRVDARYRLRVAFVTLLAAQEQVTLQGSVTDRRRQNRDLVRLRYEAGREHRGSLLAAEADFLDAEAALHAAARAQEVARHRLARVIGWDTAPELTATGRTDVALPPPPAPWAELAAHHPQLQITERELAAAEHDRASRGAARGPTVSADAQAQRSADDWPPDEDSWSVGLSASFPLTDGGSRRARERSAQSRVRELREDLRSVRLDLELALLEAWRDLEDAVEQVRVENSFLAAARERARIAAAQYATGLIGFDDWTLIEDALVRAEQRHLDTRRAALVAEADWVRTLGGGMEYGLPE